MDPRFKADAWYEDRKNKFCILPTLVLFRAIQRNVRDIKQKKTDADYAYEMARFSYGYMKELQNRFPGLTIDEIETWINLQL